MDKEKLSAALASVSDKEVLDQAERDFDKTIKKKSRRGAHWAKKREEEQGRFNVYKMPTGAAEILLWISRDKFSIGIEIQNLCGVFTGNFDRDFAKDVEKRAKALGFQIVQLTQEKPKTSWRSLSAKRFWANPEIRARMLKNLEKARKARTENRKKKG